MQQSSATQSLHLSFWGLRKVVACSHSSSQCLLVSTVFGTVSSLHPTSVFILVILYTSLEMYVHYCSVNVNLYNVHMYMSSCTLFTHSQGCLVQCRAHRRTQHMQAVVQMYHTCACTDKTL